MAIKTLDDLQSKLQRELGWRKKEIANISLVARQSGPERHYFFRSGLVLLCAHWEGYLKTAVQRYMEHVLAQRLHLRELSAPFVAAILFKDVRRAAEANYPGSEQAHLRLARTVLAWFAGRADSVPCWDVATEGNPGSEVLARILASSGLDTQLGLDEARWAATKAFIDQQIVAARHQVAHGEYLKIERDELLERAARVTELLEAVTQTVLRAAECRSYMSAPPKKTDRSGGH